MAICGGFATDGTDMALANKCAVEFQKVTTCLIFAIGKAATASQECCEAVEDLK